MIKQPGEGENLFSQDSESFHSAIGPVLAMAQFFGALPVSGVRSPTPLKLKFAKLSFHTAYAALITTTMLIMAILSVIHMIRTLNSSTFEVRGKQIKCILYASQKSHVLRLSYRI